MRHTARPFVASLHLLIAAAASAAGGWPQWRGPGRDAVVTGGPAVVPWGADGPALLWQSDPIPGTKSSGYGSVVESEGRLYLYASWSFADPVDTRTLKDDALKDLGWTSDTFPADKVAQVEAARASDERRKLTQAQVNDWADGWLKGQWPDEKDRNLLAFARDRLVRGGRAIELDALARIGAARGRVFPDEAAWQQWLGGQNLPEPVRKEVDKVVTRTHDYTKDTIVCVDAATGRTVWKTVFDIGAVHQWGSSSTACVADGRVLAMGSTGLAYGLKADDGAELWKAELGKGAESSSFLVRDGVAYVQTSRGAFALDPATGAVKWTQEKTASNACSPVWMDAGGTPTLLCNTAAHVYGLDPKTGEVRWSAPGGLYCTPAVSGDRVVLMTEKNGLVCYAVAGGKAEQAWKIDARDRGTSPVIRDGRVYVTPGGEALCADLESGRLLWRKKIAGGEIASPVWVDGKLLAPFDAGKTVALLQPGDADCEVLAKARLEIAHCGIPCVAGGTYYARKDDGIYAYRLSAP